MGIFKQIIKLRNKTSMKAFAVLFACLSVAAGDTWACAECDRGQQELTNILTSESGLQLTCLDCQWRIKWSLQILREPMTEQYWVAKLRKGGFCSENYRGFEEICDGHLDDTFLNALHWMTDNSWVNSFCYDNFGCQA